MNSNKNEPQKDFLNNSQSSEPNDSEHQTLLEKEGTKINNTKHSVEPPSLNFQNELREKILEKQRKRPSMKNPFAIFGTLLKSKRWVPVTVIVLILAIIFNLVYFWPTKETGGPLPVGDFFTGFSKLIISPVHAKDNFELYPTASDSLGVEAISAYVLKSKEPVSVNLIKENLKVEPEIDYEVKEVSSQEWQIIPKEPIEPNALIKIALATSYTDEQGERRERDYSWVYQVKDTFKVLHSIPRDTGTNVPTNTGIEITFSHDNFLDFEKYFEISPPVQGRFEKHGRTLVFVPTSELKPGALYTVNVRSGLPLSDSEETLGEEYSFTFETTPVPNRSTDQWFDVYQKFIEMSSKEAPLVQVSTYNLPSNKIEVSVYKFSTWQEYLKSLRERDNLPWWSYSKDNFRQDTSSLQKINSFTQEIKTNNRIQYIEFPESLSKGLYLLELTSGEDKEQAWLQITDLSAYLNVSKTATLVWVNDLNTSSTIANASIELLGTEYNYQTNQKGIAEFTTPKELIINASDEKQTERYYFKITKGDDILLIPASQISRSYWYSSANTSDDYWKYLYTDRPRYQPTDTIKYWGLLKKRDSQKIDKEITVTLYKEGYVDYYYRPVSITEQKITPGDFDTFSGEIKLNNVRPDYYSLEIKVGDDVIKRSYISIRPYIKPAYELTLVPEKRAAYADENVKIKAKAAFFEGTPVPDLKLVFKTPESEKVVTTNNLGEVELSYTKVYVDCNEDYSCWPKYAHLSIRPEEGELAEITADAYIRFYGPEVYLKSEEEYPEAGVAEVNLISKAFDLDSITDSSWWRRSDEDKAAPNVKIEGEVIKITYTRRETGTYYDFINKKTYKTYDYDKRTEKVDTFSIVTDNKGKYTYQRQIEPETSYELKMKIYDSKGRFDVYTTYLYYYNGRSLNFYSDGGYSYYHLKTAKEGKYSVGDEVVVSFMRNEELMPAGEDRYLFIQFQNGLQEYSITNDSEYRFTFENRDIPNVNLTGVYFNGASYIITYSSYYGQSIDFDTSKRTLNIDIKTDKEKYEPGEEVELSLEVKDPAGSPVKAEVNLNLIDEAFYAVVDNTATPMETIYSRIGPGSLYSGKSHHSIAEESEGVEKGCFAAGTVILMAGGTKKPIEKIKPGDKVMTFSDPIEKKLVVGEVTKIWQHTVAEYLIINNEIKVTPEHQMFANDRFTDAGTLMVGDWLLNFHREKIFIKSLEIVQETIPVYNFQVEPQHTYFAAGFYVHNQEKGGGPRELFTDAALFQNVQTSSSGKATVQFKLPDNITSWRVTAQAISKDLFVGANLAKIPVSLPVFTEVSIGEEYLDTDKPVARLRAFGTNLDSSDNVNFTIKAPSLGVSQSSPLTALAFKPAYFDLPELKLGRHDIIYELKTAKGDDAIKLPLNVIQSRLQAQVVKSEILTTDTKVTVEDPNQPVLVVLSDKGQNQLYAPLQSLSWSWGDRVDQILTRKKARFLLRDLYKEEIILPKFDSFNYQTSNGGITLLPYSSEELELSARVAALGADDFDEESLAQYLFGKLENRTSNREEISLALFGLASLKKSVLPRIDSWLGREDLSPKEKLYLAQALFNLGAGEQARELYYEVMEKYAEEKEPHIIVRVSDNNDEVFHATALAAVLATSLNAQESTGLWEYLINNHWVCGLCKNSDNLFNLEELSYITRTLPNLKSSPAKVVYKLFGKRQEVNISGFKTHSFQLEPEQANELEFLSIEGEVGISISQIKPIDLSQLSRDSDISISREYYVNGQLATTFKETDTVEVRLYPSFGANALAGAYQITDILPSGLMPVTKLYVGGGGYDCHYWYPYDTEGQLVKYRVSRDWSRDYCGGNYIKYYARVKTRGEYKAEPAIIQSFINPDYLNYSQVKTIKITE